MKYCIVVLNYNDYDTTKEFIEKINKTNSDLEIIIVDNNSTDDSYSKLKAEFGQSYDVVQTDKNGGYAYGNNYGVKYAIEKYGYKYCAICNPDVIINPQIFNKALHILNTDEKKAIVGFKMLDKNKEVQKYCWKMPSYWYEVLSSLVICNKLFLRKRDEYSEKYLSDDISKVDVVAGSCMFIDIDKFVSMGLFDENTFLFCEEQILGKKAKDKGFDIVVMNNETYIHNHSVSINKSFSSILSKYVIHQNSKGVYIKNYLKCSKLKYFIFNIVTKIGWLERKLALTMIKKR